MKKILFRNDKVIFLVCLLASGICFVFDLMLPWALGSILYVMVLILTLRASKKQYLFWFAGLSSILTLGVVMATYNEIATLGTYLDEVLVLLVIWATAGSLAIYRNQQEGKLFLSAIVDSSHDAIISKTNEGIITSWNGGAEFLFGYTAKEIIGQSAQILISESNPEEESQILHKVTAGEKIAHFETVRVRKGGQHIDVSLTISPIKNAAGKVVGISSVARDITEQVRQHQLLKELNEQILIEKNKLEEVLSIEEGLNSLLRYNKLIDFVVEKTAKILEAQRCSFMLFDDKSQELCLKGYVGLQEESAINCRHKIGDPIAGIIAQRGEPVLVSDIETDCRFARSNRPGYQKKSFMSAPIKIGDRLMGIINVADKLNADFTALDLKILIMIARQVGVALESSRIHREVTYLSITDSLTGIFNHRHFTTVLDHEIERAKRYESPLSILLIDIDDFKSYNDQFGHLEGDILLITLGQTINKNIRKVDVACRYGGDEFVVILPEASAEQAKIVCEKIRQQVKELTLKRKVTVSIGSATYRPSMNRYDLVQRADAMLYESKKTALASDARVT